MNQENQEIVLKHLLEVPEGKSISRLREWLNHEWHESGCPVNYTQACYCWIGRVEAAIAKLEETK